MATTANTDSLAAGLPEATGFVSRIEAPVRVAPMGRLALALPVDGASVAEAVEGHLEVELPGAARTMLEESVAQFEEEVSAPEFTWMRFAENLSREMRGVSSLSAEQMLSANAVVENAVFIRGAKTLIEATGKDHTLRVIDASALLGNAELENEARALFNAMGETFKTGRLVIAVGARDFEKAQNAFGASGVRIVKADNFEELKGALDPNARISYTAPATDAGSKAVQAIMDNEQSKKATDTINVVDLSYGVKPVLAAALAGGALTQDRKLVAINLASNSPVLLALSQKYPNEILVLQRVWEYLKAMWNAATQVSISA